MLKDLFGLRRLLGTRTLTGVLSFESMWFLRDSPNLFGKPGLSSVVKGALEDIRANALAILPGNVPHDVCDALIRDFEGYCAEHPESANYRDEYSLHERLACLHLVSESARQVVFDRKVGAIVEAAFGTPFVVVGSLFFEKGSTQSIHRDTPAFFTNPLNHFFGVWTA